MIVRKLVYGIYPRNERLRLAIGRYERGGMDKEDLAKVINEEKNNFYELMKSEKIDFFTDPLFNWHDIFRPLAANIEGMSIGPLTRYFDNNTFYRKPIVNHIGKLQDIFHPKSFGEYELPYPAYSIPESSNYTVFLPGIGTFYNLSESKMEWRNFRENLVDLYNEIILKNKGKTVFFYEPSPRELDIYSSFKEKVIIGLPRKVSDLSLRDVNVFSIVGEDIFTNSKHCEIPGIPVLKAKTTRLEENLIGSLKPYSNDFPEVIITHDDYLDFLPRKISDLKVKTLGGVTL